MVLFGDSPRRYYVRGSFERAGNMGKRAVRPAFGGAIGHALWNHGHPYREIPYRAYLRTRPRPSSALL